jgi:5-formyltetrahydrofolate cyclo-ligase
MTLSSESFEAVAAAKAALRLTVKARRDALSPAARAAFSARITARLLELDSYCAAQTVLAYSSFGSEFDTSALIRHALAQGKTLLLPRVVRGSRDLALHVVKDLGRDLQPGVWGILEPKPECAHITQVFYFKWILVPGLAFTPGCERLGYGAGFYDRLIARCTQKPALVAAAFATQMVDEMPCTTADQRVELVVTEDAVYPS